MEFNVMFQSLQTALGGQLPAILGAVGIGLIGWVVAAIARSGLIVLQRRVAVSFDPHASHRVVEDLVVLDDPQTSVVNEYASILSSPDLITLNERITSRPRYTDMT